MDFSEKTWHDCVQLLQAIADNPSLIENDERMKALLAKIHRSGKKQSRARARDEVKAADLQIRSQTGRVRREFGFPANETDVPTTLELERRVSCYICKRPYRQLHHFYHLLCPDCAEFNFAKRGQRADLRGRTALITGGRVKIGQETALRLLRDGARVYVTTRFPADAARRFLALADAPQWRDRLHFAGLDLRFPASVEAFVSWFSAREPSLDILIHNAAQTVQRPAGFYAHLTAGETRFEPAIEGFIHTAPNPALLPQLAPGLEILATLPNHFPPGALDLDGQQIDLRPENSWTLALAEVGTVELLEVHLVNAIAPFILNAHLKPLMERSPHARRFIVNVSAMEGQFNRAGKTIFHPHTNMAKAALNMMTRTSAADYVRSGIFMNSVDTGWITDENPAPKLKHIREVHNFCPPLDSIDGMARIYDPIAQGINREDEPFCGEFLKDFAPHPW